MKKLFITAHIKKEVNNLEISKFSKKSPKKIAIVYSNQYEKQAKKIREILSSKNKEIIYFNQILGCSEPKISAQAILCVSEGKFHALSLIKNNAPIYIYNRGKITMINKEGIKNMENKKKASYLKFLNAKKIGIIISTKPQQMNINTAIKIKNKIKNKKTYLFISNNINNHQFENFPEIQSWINTACPRLDMDNSKIINKRDLNFSNTKDCF